jgi:hypothetical protein
MPLFVEAWDDRGQAQRFGGRRYVRLRVHTRPGSLLSLVVTETGGWRLAEQRDSRLRPRLLAQGRLPSGAIDEEPPSRYRH